MVYRKRRVLIGLKGTKFRFQVWKYSVSFLCTSMIFFRQDDPIKDTTLSYHCNLPSDVCISMNDYLDEITSFLGVFS